MSSSNQPTYEEILQQLQEARKTLAEVTQKTSLQEALRLWHTLYSDPKTFISRIKVNASQFTSPAGRVSPRYLHPWFDFEQFHRQAWNEIVKAINEAENPAFQTRSQYENEASEFMPRVFLRHEHQLVVYLIRTLEDRVVSIFKRMNYNITFQDPEKNPLVDLTNRVENMDLIERPSTPTARQYDKLCSIGEAQSDRPVMVIEYKAAHKLTPALFENFDSTRTYDMNSIFHRHKVATQEDERQQEVSEEVMAVVITQTFDYMIDQGVSYGYVTGGQAFLFLYYDPEEPQTVFYQCRTVKPDLFESNDHDVDVSRNTAVGLIAAFVRLTASWG